MRAGDDDCVLVFRQDEGGGIDGPDLGGIGDEQEGGFQGFRRIDVRWLRPLQCGGGGGAGLAGGDPERGGQGVQVADNAAVSCPTVAAGIPRFWR
jgi:hypothetical protein